MFTILFGLYIFVILTFFFVLSVIAFVVCYPFDKRRRVVHEISRILCMAFWRIPPMWRREIVGLENADKHQPYVIVLNHNSMADIIALYFVPLNFRWVSKREVFRIPYIGAMLCLHGDIAIERGRGAEAMHKVIHQGKEWLSRGVSVSMFPEGTRSKDGEIHRFKQGAFILAKEAGVPILPIVLDGTTKVFKSHYLFNWHHKLTLHVLPAVSAEEVQQCETAELMERVQKSMVEELAAIRGKHAEA